MTLFSGWGGGMQFYRQNDFMDIWAFLKIIYCKRLTIAIPINRSLHIPPAPESPKSLKKVFPGLPVRSVKKVSKKPQRTRKRVKTSVRGPFRHFFDTTGREAREDLLETFWGSRGWGVRSLLYMGIVIVGKDDKTGLFSK